MKRTIQATPWASIVVDVECWGNTIQPADTCWGAYHQNLLILGTGQTPGQAVVAAKVDLQAQTEDLEKRYPCPSTTMAWAALNKRMSRKQKDN